MEHACFSTSSGVEIHLKLVVSKVAAKATALGGGCVREGRGSGGVLTRNLRGQAGARKWGWGVGMPAGAQSLKISSRHKREC